MELNKYQTPIEELIYKKVDEKTNTVQEIKFEDAPEEIRNEFMEALSTVPFIQWLISKDRPNIKDLPRDEKGRAIWRIEYPPIIEDIDYFRPTAICFEETGKLTSLRPNPNPNSAYKKWEDEEVRRIRDGYLREDDGAYIPGYMYWYLNYCPIILTEISEDNSDVGDRVVGMPKFWEGILWRFTGWELARTLGKYFFEISKRGSSKSYCMSSGLSKGFVIGDRKPSPQHKSFTRGILLADNKDFLIKDGTLNKFESMIDFQAQNTEFPRKRLKSSLNEMAWTMGYIDLNTGTKKGTGNEVLGVAIKDDPDKARGKRASLFCLEEIGKFPHLATVMKIAERSVKDGNVVFGLLMGVGTGGEEGCLTDNNLIPLEDGRLVKPSEIRITDRVVGYDIVKQEPVVSNIEHINVPSYKECVRITTNSFRTLECSIDHPIYSSNHYNSSEIRVWDWIQAENLNIGDKIAISQSVPFFGESTVFDPYLIGLLIGDGCYLTSPRIISCDKEIHTYLEENYDVKIYNKPYLTKDGRTVKEYGIRGIRDNLRGLGIYGQSKNSKVIPEIIFRSTKDTICNVLAGLLDTDGCITVSENKGNRKPVCDIYYSSSSLRLVQQVQTLFSKLGIYGTILKKEPSHRERTIKDNSPYYSLLISSAKDVIKTYESIKLKIKYKQERLRLAYEVSKTKKPWRKQNFIYETITSIERIGEKKIFNISVEGIHTYLGNGIVTHNSDFSGALDLIYHPAGSNVLSFENVWDKSAQSRGTSIFCFPAYVNRLGCYNKDGISDVTLALYQICWERYIAKYENPDPMAITRTKAEDPITLQDAIMRRDGTKFPVAQITERIQEIDLNPNFYDNILVGKLIQKNSGEVVFEPTADKAIHKFPTKDNKVAGAVEIKELPKKNRDGRVFSNRYIGSLDPIDDDSANTMSLVSCFILDLWTDEIVAEWTGRLNSAEACYEVVRLLCKFYNAKLMYEQNKKGLYSYFKMMNCLNLLAETPQFIRDKEDSKVEKIGNKLYGINATNPINNYARDRLKDFMLKPVEVEKEVDGQKQMVTIPNVMTWWNRALLEEARQWNPDGNFDRISSMGMLMLYREEKYVASHGTITKDDKPLNTKANDPFFERNYRPNKPQNTFNSNQGWRPSVAENIHWN